jgi:hypothetical protein
MPLCHITFYRGTKYFGEKGYVGGKMHLPFWSTVPYVSVDLLSSQSSILYHQCVHLLWRSSIFYCHLFYSRPHNLDLIPLHVLSRIFYTNFLPFHRSSVLTLLDLHKVSFFPLFLSLGIMKDAVVSNGLFMGLYTVLTLKGKAGHSLLSCCMWTLLAVAISFYC